MAPLEFNIFFAGKLFYASYIFLLPSLYGIHPAGSFLSLYVASQCITSSVLTFFAQVAHLVDDVEFPTPEECSGALKVKGGWAAMQIGHHLLPGVCYLNYPSIQSIVKETCKEFNVPYLAYPTLYTYPLSQLF